MAKMTKKTEERIHTGLAKFQKILAIAKARDRRVLCVYCRSPLLAADAAVCSRCGREVSVSTMGSVATIHDNSDDRLQQSADARAIAMSLK